MNWLDAMRALSSRGEAFVTLGIIHVKGSAPRAVGAKMVVSADKSYDSIGGGNLEHTAMLHAREMLRQNAGAPAIEQHDYPLGADLSQCCGGHVTLLYECFPACDFHIVLCGAGHVAQALVAILKDLPCRITWLDSRADFLSQSYAAAGAPANVAAQPLTNPFAAIEDCPPNAYYLIMTHSHDEDFELCEAVLGRADVAYCGLIGSDSKAASFRGRLKRKKFSPEEIARLTSPMGLDLGGGKRPMEVAVSTAAQLLQIRASVAREKSAAKVRGA